MPPLTEANAIIRSQNVTASEVGALMGVHPYTDAADIYDRLMGEERFRDSEAMQLGSFLESAILRFAERRDLFRSRLNQRTFVHRDVRLCATPDAFQTSRDGLFVPERALIEIKMSGRPDIWRDVPEYIDWQARAQMACTGRDTVYVYVLVGMRLLVFQRYRDPEKEAAMLDRVQRFWTDNIVARVRPEPAVPVMPITFSFDAVPQETIA